MTAQAHLDIESRHLAIVREILREHVPRCRVWAFGSRATGKAKRFSDLDLAIECDQPISIDLGAALAEAFSESDLPWKVDIVDLSTVDPSFRKLIERDRVVIQEASGRQA